MSSDKDKDVKKKLKDVNMYTVDELKELLGLSTDPDEYTVDDIQKHFWLLSNRYPRLARDGFLGMAKDIILKDLLKICHATSPLPVLWVWLKIKSKM